MKRNDDPSDEGTMLPEYDFTKGVRGKYAGRYAEGSNVVVLDPDVAAEYPTAQAVNEALRQASRRKREREAR